jgi:hypothetical protein
MGMGSGKGYIGDEVEKIGKSYEGRRQPFFRRLASKKVEKWPALASRRWAERWTRIPKVEFFDRSRKKPGEGQGVQRKGYEK